MPRQQLTKQGQQSTKQSKTSHPKSRQSIPHLPLGILVSYLILFWPHDISQYTRRTQSLLDSAITKNLSFDTVKNYKGLIKNCTLYGQSYECGPVYNVGGPNRTSYRESLLKAQERGLDPNDVWNTWIQGNHPHRDSNPISPNKRTMKVIVMTMNEWPLIAWWTFYHGEMLGFENLYIVDGSTDSRCIQFLQQARDEYHVNVIFSKSDLNNVVVDINDIMLSVSVASDLMIKLDTDEFLAVVPESESCPNQSSLVNKMTTPLDVSCRLSPYGLQKYIDSSHFPLDGSKLRIGFTSLSVPDKDTCEGPSKGNDPAKLIYTEALPTDYKAFFDSRTFEDADLGSHMGVTLPPFQEKIKYTALGTLHLHSRCFQAEIESSRQATIRHGYMNEEDSDEVALAKFRNLLQHGYPTKENNCAEAMNRSWTFPSVHKVFQVMQYMLCPEAIEERYYQDRPPAHPNEELAKYIHHLREKYPIPVLATS
jgi:hypothetical protein